MELELELLKNIFIFFLFYFSAFFNDSADETVDLFYTFESFDLLIFIKAISLQPNSFVVC